MRCVVSSYRSVDTSVIERVLARQGVEVVGPSPDSRLSFTERRDIDFLVAVLPSASSLLLFDEKTTSLAPPAVYLEIGFAIGAQIPVLLIAEAYVRVPPSLAGLQYVTCDLDNEPALELHLQNFVRNIGQEPVFRPSEDKRVSSEVITRARTRVQELDSMPPNQRGPAYEQMCISLLSHCTDSLLAVGRSDRGADLVTWLDPIGVVAIELKIGRLTQHVIGSTERQLMDYLSASRANLGMLLLHDIDGSRHPATKTSALVFRMEFVDLLNLLEDFSFKRILQTERNALVHGF